MDKQFHPKLRCKRDYYYLLLLSIEGLALIHVCRRGPWVVVLFHFLDVYSLQNRFSYTTGREYRRE